MLYDEGIVIETPEYPHGIINILEKLVSTDTVNRNSRAGCLVAIIADHPAMVKLCGFADHSHNVAPCTKCMVSQKDLFTEESLRNGNVHMCQRSLISQHFSQNFRLAVANNIGDSQNNTETSEPRTKKTISLRSTEYDGPNLLGLNTLILCGIRLLIRCIIYCSVESHIY
jgi:hypothetical protein